MGYSNIIDSLVDNAYVRLLKGSKDNLFYKNGHVAVARVDIK